MLKQLLNRIFGKKKTEKNAVRIYVYVPARLDQPELPLNF